MPLERKKHIITGQASAQRAGIHWAEGVCILRPDGRFCVPMVCANVYKRPDADKKKHTTCKGVHTCAVLRVHVCEHFSHRLPRYDTRQLHRNGVRRHRATRQTLRFLVNAFIVRHGWSERAGTQFWRHGYKNAHTIALSECEGLIELSLCNLTGFNRKTVRRSDMA